MKIRTTEKYWDCECETNYIHSKEEKECKICYAHNEDCSDSRMAEVKEWLKK